MLNTVLKIILSSSTNPFFSNPNVVWTQSLHTLKSSKTGDLLAIHKESTHYANLKIGQRGDGMRGSTPKSRQHPYCVLSYFEGLSGTRKKSTFQIIFTTLVKMAAQKRKFLK